MFGHDHGHRRHGPFGKHGNWFDLFRQQSGPRARRGDIRAGILALLKEGPRNGYQLMQELSDRSGGMWRPSPGSVYPALQLLEDEGLVEVDASASGKVYTLTKRGKTYVEQHADEIGEPWKRGQEQAGSGGDDMFELMTLVKQLAPAVVQVVATGSPAQLKEARKILGAARRKLYTLLAQTDEDDEDADEDANDDVHDR